MYSDSSQNRKKKKEKKRWEREKSVFEVFSWAIFNLSLYFSVTGIIKSLNHNFVYLLDWIGFLPTWTEMFLTILRDWVFFSVSCGENTQQSRRGQQDRIRLTWTTALKEVSFSSAGALMPQCQLSNPIIQAGYDCVWPLPGTGRTRTDTRISRLPAAGRAQPHISTLA